MRRTFLLGRKSYTEEQRTRTPVSLTSGAQADDPAGVTVRLLSDGEDTEVVGGSTWRRAPQERRGIGGDAGAERNPLPDGPVLNDVVVDGDAAWMSRYVPLDQQVWTDLLNGHVVRRCWSRT